MKHYSILLVILWVTWYCFSGYFDAFFLGCGLVSSALAVFVARKMQQVIGEESSDAYLKVITPSFWLYSLWLVKEVIVSSVSVSSYVWKRRLSISPVMSWVPSSVNKDEAVAAYANSITLTPGTVCIDTIDYEGERKMLVHALIKSNLVDMENIDEKGSMDMRVKQVMEGK